MARYRKIDVRIWRDHRFMALSAPQPNGRDCWLYLLTNAATTNIPGVYHAYEEALARGLGWSLIAFRKVFAEVAAQGLAKADWDAGLVFIPNGIKYDPPASVNVIKSWADTWDELPECGLKTEAHARLASFIATLGPSFRDAFEEACPAPDLIGRSDVDEQRGFTEAPPQVFGEAFTEGSSESFGDAFAEGDVLSDNNDGVRACAIPEQEQDPEQEQEKELVAPASQSRPAGELFGDVQGEEADADEPPAAKPPPLPFKADEALAAIAAASSGRFVATKLNRGQAINAQRIIRAHPDLADWRLVGEWLGVGGEAWKTELDARSLGNFEAWFGHASKWRDDGKPVIERHASRASPTRRDLTRGQVPVVEGLDYSTAGGGR